MDWAASSCGGSNLKPSGSLKSAYFSGTTGASGFLSSTFGSTLSSTFGSVLPVRKESPSGVVAGVGVVLPDWSFKVPSGVLAAGSFPCGGSFVTVTSVIDCFLLAGFLHHLNVFGGGGRHHIFE